MKKTHHLLIVSVLCLASLLSLASCENAETSATPTSNFNARVISKGLDCGNVYLIKFNDDVIGLPANSFNNVFYAINLPSQLQVEDLQVNVGFRAPNPDEFIACTTMGIGYPQIIIENPN